MHKLDRAQRGRSKVLVVAGAFRDLITLLQQDLISQHVLINLDCITSIPGKPGLFTASCSTSVCTNNHCLAALDLLNRTHPTNRQKTMPKLDNRGIIAAATIGFYIPPAILTYFCSSAMLYDVMQDGCGSSYSLYVCR